MKSTKQYIPSVVWERIALNLHIFSQVKITATWLTWRKARAQKVSGPGICFCPKRFRQSPPQHTGDSSRSIALLISTISIASELGFVSNMDFVSPQNRHADVGFEAPKELHQVDSQQAKAHGSRRKQLFDHGQATANGDRGSGLAASALVCLPTKSTQAAGGKITPIK